MKTCAKCSKSSELTFHTAYGEDRCADCWDDYLMTDKGKVEYLISLVKGDCHFSQFDADFLGWVSKCWKQYRQELDLSMWEIEAFENKAVNLGLL